MLTWALLLAVAGLLAGPVSAAASDSTVVELARRAAPRDALARRSQHLHQEGELIVRFKSATSSARRGRAHARARATRLRSLRAVRNLELVRIPKDGSIEEAIAAYENDPGVLYAEPNYIVEALAIPNDPLFGDPNYTPHLQNSRDADIDAPEAWDITTGSDDVVVAVIDTGVKYTHPDLAANVFRNEPECDNDGIDDDLNGYVDDCHGIDTVNGDSDPWDDADTPHGTHVSGILGARGNNGIGVPGVNWNVRIVACKFLDEFGSGSSADAIDCLGYVKDLKDSGVNIVATNNSWGGGGYSQALVEAIDAQRESGILFVSSAGNAYFDNDSAAVYPATYYLPNVLSVAATDKADNRAGFSNVGKQTVHLGAPGEAIMSTYRADGYATLSGTSMAAPMVTGVAALLAANDPSLDWLAIKNLILAGADVTPQMASKVVTGGRLNAYESLTCSSSVVRSRLRPIPEQMDAAVGVPIHLSALHIDCADPNGSLQVVVSPGNEIVALEDDGTGNDQLAGDGVYSGEWTPPSLGSFTFAFPGDDDVVVNVVSAPGTILNPTPADGDGFGQSLLVLDPDTLIVGAPGDDTAAPDAGAVYVYDLHTGELLRTLTDPSAVGGERIGFILAPAGTNLLVGAPGDDRQAANTGAAYLFNPSTGAMLRRFENPSPDVGDNFGDSVAMAGGNVVVGAPWDQTAGLASGSSYVFDPDTGDLVLTLLNPFARQGTFGSAMIALPDDQIAIAEPLTVFGGQVHQYDLDPQSPGFGGLVRTYGHQPQSPLAIEFGRSLAVSGDLLFVGDTFGVGGQGCGSACVGALHVFDTATGDFVRLLQQPISGTLVSFPVDLFTWALSAAGDNLFVTTPAYDRPPGFVADQYIGAVFLISASTGLPVEFFLDPVERQYNSFGTSVAATEGAAFVGAPADWTGAPVSGAVFKLTPATQRRTKCYKGRDATKPRFAAQNVTMTDRLGTWQASAKKPASLCAPVEVETMGVDDPSAYYTCYKLTGDELQGDGDPLPHELGVFGLFGPEKVKLRKATSLCVPSGTDGAPIPDLDALRCYRASLGPNQPFPSGVSKPEPRELAFRDDFDDKLGTARTIKEICLSADIGAGIVDPSLVVACYSLKNSRGQERYRGDDVPVTNAFGTRTFRTKRGSTVCVPVSEVAFP